MACPPESDKGGPADTGTDSGLDSGPTTDADNDGFDAVEIGGTDCDDSDATVYPGAPEVCDDGVVNDCGGDAETANTSCGLPVQIDLSAADATLVGEVAGDGAGHSSVASAGDVNGDGKDDMIIGAEGHDAGGAYAGATYLVLGPVSGRHILSEASARLVGEASGDASGGALSGGGDLDGDGLDDLVIGAFDADEGGAVYIVSGLVSGTVGLGDADSKVFSESKDDHAGVSVSVAGDVDGDGQDDLLIGAYGESSVALDAGAAYLISGPISGAIDLGTADAKLLGELVRSYAGQSVAGVGDVDGDGLGDLLIGANGESADGVGTGAAYLVLGAVSGTVDLGDADARLDGEAAGDIAGWNVASAGDVDGDGHNDLFVSAPHESSVSVDAGAAYLVLGPTSGRTSLADAEAKMLGENEGDNAGGAISGAGDVNGDGLADLVVGAGANGSPRRYAGAAYLLLGPVSGTLPLTNADTKLIGRGRRDGAGSAVAGAGDTNGDGLADLLVGSGYKRHWTNDTPGAAYLVLGAGY